MTQLVQVTTGAIVVLLSAVLWSAAQDRNGNDSNAVGARSTAFSLQNDRDVLHLLRSRKSAIREATKVLVSNSKNDNTRLRELDEIAVAGAAKILSELRANDEPTINALFAHLTIQPVVFASDDADLPLTLFPVARSLSEIGGHEAAEGVIRHMKQKLDRRELLICAHILNQNDYHRVTFERLRIAKEQARLEEPQEVREVFFHNLAQVQQWIEDPRFETDEKFKP